MGPDPGLSVPKFLLSSTTLLTHLLIVNMEDYIYIPHFYIQINNFGHTKY